MSEEWLVVPRSDKCRGTSCGTENQFVRILAAVQFDGNRYTVYDENSQEVNNLYASNYGNGDLYGFGTDFFVLQDGDRYVIVNAENGQEIKVLYSCNVGRFKHANGRLIVFEDGSRIVTHEVGCSEVSEISSRYV